MKAEVSKASKAKAEASDSDRDEEAGEGRAEERVEWRPRQLAASLAAVLVSPIAVMCHVFCASLGLSA